MKTFLKYSLLMAAVCMTFAACGGDSDDDDIPGGGNAQIGVHRVDLHFDNALPQWSNVIIVCGVKPNSNFSKLYENGKELPLISMEDQNVGYVSEDVRDYSINTESGCGFIEAEVLMFSLDGKPAPHDVTVTAVGYVNDKRIYTKVFTLPAGSISLVVGFNTGNGGESEFYIDGKLAEKDHA